MVAPALSSDEQESSKDEPPRKSSNSKQVRRKSASSVEEVQEADLAADVVEVVTTSDGQSVGHDGGRDMVCDLNLIDKC